MLTAKTLHKSHHHPLRTALPLLQGVALILLASCSQRPETVLSDKEMTSLLVDLTEADAYAALDRNYALNDVNRRNLRASILKAHGVTEAKFNATLDWYGHHIDDYRDLYDDVIDRIKRDSQAPQQQLTSTDGNLWTGAQRLAATNLDNTTVMTFELGAGVVKAGETLQWQFSTFNANGQLKAVMAADYTDGTHEFVSRTFSHSPQVTLSMRLKPDKTATRVFGYTHYKPVFREPVFVDSITLTTRSDELPGAPSASGTHSLPGTSAPGNHLLPGSGTSAPGMSAPGGTFRQP